MAENKKSAKTTLTKEQKLALYNKVEIPVPGSKEKIVNYEDKEVELVALPAAKHLTPGEKYSVDSSTAVILIEKGFAEVAK